MKKIDAIIKGRKFTDKLFGLKRKQINRALEAARDNAEKQKEEAAIAYEKAFAEMADEDADYESIIGSLLGYEETMQAADNTIAALDKIVADLDSEVDATTED